MIRCSGRVRLCHQTPTEKNPNPCQWTQSPPYGTATLRQHCCICNYSTMKTKPAVLSRISTPLLTLGNMPYGSCSATATNTRPAAMSAAKSLKAAHSARLAPTTATKRRQHALSARWDPGICYLPM